MTQLCFVRHQLTLVQLRENLHVELHSITKWVRMNNLIPTRAKTKYSSGRNGSRNVHANSTALSLSIEGTSVEQVTEC